MMKRIILIVLNLVLVAGGCKNVSTDLDRLEYSVFDRPDSVLNVLKGMKADDFILRRNKAHYSLLMSQALDLNGICMSSDSVIYPAVRYFDKHGSADKKLKTCYYRALISENCGNSDDAMEWLKRGEEHLAKAQNHAIAGRLFTHKSILYFNLYDYRDALMNARLAADNYLKTGDTLSYAYRLNDIAKISHLLSDFKEARRALDKLEPLWKEMDPMARSLYYSNLLLVATSGKDADEIKAVIDSCRKNLPYYSEFPGLSLLMAHAYMCCGITEPVERLLSNYDEKVKDNDKDQSYYLWKSEYYEALGDMQNALRSYKKLNSICGRTTVTALDSDTKFIEERYEAQLQEMKQKQKTTSFMLSALIILAAAILLIRYISIALKTVQNELTSTEFRYEQIVKERNALLEIQENSNFLDSESLELVTTRLALLDKVFIGHLSSDPSVAKEADKKIESLLRDKDEFIVSTSKIFATAHPKFTQYLKNAGLTDFEAGYCCLYVMGLYAKDVEPYFSKNSSNIINNTIRAKLNLPKNGQKLKTFLMEKCNELEKKS